MIKENSSKIIRIFLKVFVKAADETDDEKERIIKVVNIQMSLSTRWSIIKLKERLIQMRKLLYEVFFIFSF